MALIPKGEPVLQSQIFAPQLEAAAKRVRDIAKDGSGIIRMEFADGKLKVSARGERPGNQFYHRHSQYPGGTGRTAINQKYLPTSSPANRASSFLQVYRHGPVVFEYQQSPRVLIMPMSVQWGDEKPAKQPAAVAETPAEATDETSDAEPDEESNTDAEMESSTEEENVERETVAEPTVTE